MNEPETEIKRSTAKRKTQVVEVDVKKQTAWITCRRLWRCTEASIKQPESIVVPVQDLDLIAQPITKNLLSDTIKPPAAGVPVTPADEVILFPTLAGVEVVNPNNGTSGGNPDDPLNEADWLSVTPDGSPTFVSLNDLLQRFDSLGGLVVTCPLCKATRFPDDAPNSGIVGNGVDIHYLFLNADKVIDLWILHRLKPNGTDISKESTPRWP